MTDKEYLLLRTMAGGCKVEILTMASVPIANPGMRARLQDHLGSHGSHGKMWSEDMLIATGSMKPHTGTLKVTTLKNRDGTMPEIMKNEQGEEINDLGLTKSAMENLDATCKQHDDEQAAYHEKRDARIAQMKAEVAVPEDGRYVCLRFYPNGEVKFTVRDRVGMEGWLEFNATMRYGNSLFINGVYQEGTGYVRTGGLNFDLFQDCATKFITIRSTDSFIRDWRWAEEKEKEVIKFHDDVYAGQLEVQYPPKKDPSNGESILATVSDAETGSSS